jgi:anti-sigma B factor antagonist
MEIAETKHNDVVVLGLTGRLDANTAGALEEKMLSLIDGGAQRLVVDARDLDYISSAGLRVLLVAAKRLRAVHGTVALAALKAHIKEVFDVAGFSSVFPIHPHREAALAALR